MMLFTLQQLVIELDTNDPEVDVGDAKVRYLGPGRGVCLLTMVRYKKLRGHRFCRVFEHGSGWLVRRKRFTCTYENLSTPEELLRLIKAWSRISI
jgi:hypothetical protein